MILGAGNVATHLARHFHRAGHLISCIYSRTARSAALLAGELHTSGVSHSTQVPVDADFYVVAVPDDTIPQVVRKFKGIGGIWVHTAGAVPMDVFQGSMEEHGVLYPLQTMQRGRTISLEEVPLLIEGSAPAATGRIRELAAAVSGIVREVDSDTRLGVHVAAVFANNFSNRMIAISQELLADMGLPGNLIEPLLRETFAKLTELGASDAQTGPAVRGDLATTARHLEWLRKYPEWENLYTFISRDLDKSRSDPS